MDHNQSLPLALWPEPPAFVYSVPVQMFGMGVVLAFATVMLVNLAFTARYHYPLERVNFLLQLISSFLSFLLTVSSMAATISDLKLRSSADLRRFPYLPITLPSLHWSLAETILFVILQSVSVSATNITHIQFLTLLFPSKLEKHLIVLMLGPLVLAQFGLFFLDFVKKPVIRYQDICESTLSLMYLFGLLIWGMLMNRQRAWRKDGATALFGCTTLFLAIARAAASFYHMTDQPAYWILLLSWALSIWQSWLGFWWWVSAGMGIGEVEDRLRRQERVRERYSSRKSRKHRSHKIATKRSDPTPTVSQRVSSQQAPTSESTASESSSNAASASFDRNTPSSSFTSSMTSWNMLQETRKWLSRVLPAALVRRFEQMRYEHQQGVLIAALKQVDIYQKVILRSHPMLRDKPVQ
ncbi:hypothetical protein MPSI1_003900 [Malassezia psittaci]|uniref:Uncharacterized protein n=1 Tax=Malassezia psittaci TaxID=1821823 RepID=A0AAF0JFM1_9BASI|nr:hypothetical protein MPSI1_003900 [Malassezia psittaci]